MQIKQITDAAILARRCYWLNKWIEIRGVEVVLLAVIDSGDKTNLWYMSRIPEYDQKGDENPRWNEGYEPRTQREWLAYALCVESQCESININTVKLGTVELALEGASSSGCYDENYENLMAMQFFCQGGIDFSKWNDVDGRRIMLYRAPVVVSEGMDVFDALEKTNLSEVVLDIHQAIKRVLLPSPLCMTLGLGEKKTVTYTDPGTGEAKKIYLNGVVIQDVWASLEESASKVAERLSADDFLQWKAGLENALTNICPKGKALAMVEYDEESGIQLDFYETTFLESPYVPESSACAWFFGSEEIATGPSGNPYKWADIRAVDIHETGPFEVELISVIQVTPAEPLRFYFEVDKKG